jgi:hypothetical protein
VDTTPDAAPAGERCSGQLAKIVDVLAKVSAAPLEGQLEPEREHAEQGDGGSRHQPLPAVHTRPLFGGR